MRELFWRILRERDGKEYYEWQAVFPDGLPYDLTEFLEGLFYIDEEE